MIAGAAVAEVAVNVLVTAKMEVEHATEAELLRWIESHSDEVRAAVASAVAARWREAGWLDEDRAVFVTEISNVEPSRSEDARRMFTDAVEVAR